MNSDNAGQRSRSCIDYNVGMRPALMGVQGSSMEKLCATACGRTGLRSRFMLRSGGKLNVSFKKNSRFGVTPCDLDPRNRLSEYKAPYEPFDKQRHALYRLFIASFLSWSFIPQVIETDIILENYCSN